MLKMVFGRALRFFGLFIVGAVTYSLGVVHFDWSEHLLSAYGLPKLIPILCIIALFTLLPKRNKPARHWFAILWGILFFVSLPFSLLTYLMGVDDLGIISIFLQGNSVSDTFNLGALNFLPDAIKRTAVLLLFFALSVLFYYRIKYFETVIAVFVVAFFLKNPVTVYFYKANNPSPIAQELVDTKDQYSLAITAKPQTKKNLIVIYAEGLENTFLRLPETRKYMGPIANLIDTGEEFTNVGMVHGAHYSTAGVLATQCGTPLLPFGIFNTHNAKATVQIPIYQQVKCLPDILKQDGYDVSFFVGTVLADFSLKNFLDTHSYNETFGKGDETEQERKDHPTTAWVLPDSLVFSRARAKLKTLAKSDDPFMLVVETIATHGPDGYPDKGCEVKSEFNSGMPASIKCTADHIQNFMTLVSDLNLDDNTVIAVMSDHLVWENVFTPMLNDVGHRRNLFFMLNTDQTGKIDKTGSAVDIYPTILEALGYQLKNDRANMGISLTSDKTTLAETYGIAPLSAGFEGNRALGNWFWRTK